MIATLLAADAAQRTSNPLVSLLPLLLLVGLFYALMIRPQRRRVQDQAALMRSLEVGDEVETVGGIFGTIRRVGEDTLWVEISAGTTVKVSRSAVRRKIVKESGETPGN